MAKELLDVDALADVFFDGFDLSNVVIRFGHILIIEIQRFFIRDYAGGTLPRVNAADEHVVD